MLKRTRNLFLFEAKKEALNNEVLSQLKFKGLTVLRFPTSPLKINSILKNNHSIACSISYASPDLTNADCIIIHIVEFNTDKVYEDTIVLENENIAKQFEDIALKHNCDIGDHISNSSGLTGAPTKEDCDYCRFLKGNYNKYSQRILYQSENFYVVATAGQFIKGYLLVIPKEHIMSMAQLSPEHQKEFLQVLDDVEHILKLTYKCSSVLIWENGTGNSGKGKAKDSIVHAHVHIAPSTLTAQKIQQISNISLARIDFSSLHRYSKSSYLLIRDDFNKCWCINNNPRTYIPRQYIRQLIADEYKIEGDELWNWRKHPFYDLLSETNEDITNALQKHYATLSERIKLNTN